MTTDRSTEEQHVTEQQTATPPSGSDTAASAGVGGTRGRGGADGGGEDASGAVLSPDGRYRYQLHRSWGRTSRPLVWIMLNPSTADHQVDDPTIRRVRGFTAREGFCAFTVVNLFALRSTDPRELRDHHAGNDVVGEHNDSYIREALQTAGGVVCAWGGSYPKQLAWRVRQVADVLDLYTDPGPTALGFTAAGDPRHPLYVKGDARLQSWPLTVITGATR